MPRDLTVVFAGSHRQFEEWCYRKDNATRDPRLVYVPDGDPHDVLRGRVQRIDRFVCTDGWRTRTDRDNMDEMFHHANMVQGRNVPLIFEGRY